MEESTPVIDDQHGNCTGQPWEKPWRCDQKIDALEFPNFQSARKQYFGLVRFFVSPSFCLQASAAIITLIEMLGAVLIIYIVYRTSDGVITDM